MCSIPDRLWLYHSLRPLLPYTQDDIATQARLATRSLQLAIRARQAQISEGSNIVKLRALEVEDMMKLAKAQSVSRCLPIRVECAVGLSCAHLSDRMPCCWCVQLYDNVKTEYDRHTAAMDAGTIA